MELLYTVSPIPIQDGIQEISSSSGFCYDFSGLPTTQDKKEFLYQNRGVVNYDLQKIYSTTVHNVSNHYEIDSENLIQSEETTIDMLIQGIGEPTYEFYRLLEWDQTGNSLIVGSVEDLMTDMPIAEPNYFSSVFLFGLKNIYGGNPRVLFYRLVSPLNPSQSVLGLKVDIESNYSLYDISYRPPYDSLGLI